jgi:hypothetical protein
MVQGFLETLDSVVKGYMVQGFLETLDSVVKGYMVQGFLHELFCHLFAGRDNHESRVEVARVERVRHGGKLVFDGKEVSDRLQHHLEVAKHSRMSDVRNVSSICAMIDSRIGIASTW